MILDRLRGWDNKEAHAALEAIPKMSPTSLKVTLRNIRAAATFDKVEQSFQQDYRIALACVAGHDFVEGIRATIVDKDRKPTWQPDKLADTPRWLASAGPSTSTGSSATVTAATISSRTRMRLSRRAILKPSMIRERCRSSSPKRPARQRIRVKTTNETAFPVNAQP